jgi:hypothetical protein
MSLLPDRERRDMVGGIEAAAGGPRVQFPFLAEAFAGEVERALSSNDFSRITSGELERVITAAVKLYAAKAEQRRLFQPRSRRKKLLQPKWWSL